MRNSTRPAPIYLDADDYDALELSALAFGGIGAHTLVRYLPDGTFLPNCVHGHAVDLEIQISFYAPDLLRADHRPLRSRLNAAGLTVGLSDRLLRGGERLSWREYTKRLNIVRLDASAPPGVRSR